MKRKFMILILDFGSQYTQLIARRIRELNVYSEVRPCFTKSNEIDSSAIEGIILSGGPASVTETDAPEFDTGWLELGKPVLGICYGMQLLAAHYGGELGRGSSREYGSASIQVESMEGLFRTFSNAERLSVWMSHGDHVVSAPEGFTVSASSAGAPIAAMENSALSVCGIQFHPEVVHTPRGAEMLRTFVVDIAGVEPNWTAESVIEEQILAIRNEVNAEDKVICALSGGVDSTVAAALVAKAIGNQLICFYVDTGLGRKAEADSVMKRLKTMELNVTLVDAKAKFFGALSGVVDPERKRKEIGRVFIEVFEEQAREIPGARYLVQGTLYPDVIESVSVRGPSATIKSHHNVGGLPERLNLKLIEPFRALFKDEVRLLGRELGVSRETLERQPFPGPGLAVRVLGEVTPSRVATLQEADHIFLEEIRGAGLYGALWQAFCVLLPVRSVGVMGDARTYDETIALRAVHSEDGMTADWSYLPEELLRRVSNRIVNEVEGVNRVVLDISSKPPATIEWE
jgi:GMP synthase (glutamine-hydrolysing)